MRALRNTKGEPTLVSLPTGSGEVLFPCRVRRNSRSRRMQLSVNDRKEVVLSLPNYVTLKEAGEFLSSKGDWIKETIDKQKPRCSSLDFLRKRPWVSAFGKKYPLYLRFTRVCSDYVFKRDADEVCFLMDSSQGGEADPLYALMRSFASKVVGERAKEFAARHELPLARVSVRDQSGRWGSCAESGNINLNWRLVLLPPELHDHVILHELAHLKEMNHSKRFYQFLESLDPQSDRNDRNLDLLGAELLRVGK